MDPDLIYTMNILFGLLRGNWVYIIHRQCNLIWMHYTHTHTNVFHTHTQIYIYMEYVMGDSDLSDAWTNDGNIYYWTSVRRERVDESYVAGTWKYLIWHYLPIGMLYIKCDTEIDSNSNSDIETALNNCAVTHIRMTYWIHNYNVFLTNIYISCIVEF